MPRLAISLLGPFQVTVDGVPVTSFESDKVRALLAYLAVEARAPHRRERLAGLLWPEQPERSARTNLRHVLANLRTAIGDREALPPFLAISHQTVQFNQTGATWIDVLTFIERLETSQAASQPCIEGLQQAVDLVRGEFLEGFSLPGCPGFEEWAQYEGERLQRLALNALARLSSLSERQGSVQRALDCAGQVIELDPGREEAHRRLMRLLLIICFW